MYGCIEGMFIVCESVYGCVLDSEEKVVVIISTFKNIVVL